MPIASQQLMLPFHANRGQTFEIRHRAAHPRDARLLMNARGFALWKRRFREAKTRQVPRG
jgi:hypothetical protein